MLDQTKHKLGIQEILQLLGEIFDAPFADPQIDFSPPIFPILNVLKQVVRALCHTLNLTPAGPASCR